MEDQQLLHENCKEGGILADIKIRQKEIGKRPIKKVDRKSIYKNRLKNNIVKIKERDK